MDTSYLVKRYAVVSVITMIAIGMLGYLIEVFFNHDIGSAGGVVSMIVPAMDAGQAYVRRGHGRPANGFAWKMAAVFLAINMAIGVALMSVVLLVFGGGGDLWEVISGVGGGGFAIIAIGSVILLAFSLLAIRFSFGFGAKNQLKVQEKLVAKKQP